MPLAPQPDADVRIAGRLQLSDWGSVAATLGYLYNNFGLVSQVSYPEGAVGKGGAFSVTNVYRNGYAVQAWDTIDWQQDPAALANAQARATYNAAGGFQQIVTRGSGGTVILPDMRNRPSRITIGTGTYDPATDTFSAGTHHQSGAYPYDGAGNIYRVGANKYVYDPANRLVFADDVYDAVFRTQTFAYDDFGNLVRKIYEVDNQEVADDRFTVRDAATVVNRNRILKLQQRGDDPEPGRAFDYDARGNLILSDTQNGKTTYVYDTRNRLAGVRNLAGGMETEVGIYAYDEASNRITKRHLGLDLWTYFIRDGQGRLMSEFRRSHNVQVTPEWSKHYLYLGDRLVGLRENMIPGPPGRLTATTTGASVTLSWRASPAGEGPQVTGYKIYRSPTTSEDWRLLQSVSGLSYVDNQVTVGTLYKYLVTAVDDQSRESYGQGALVVLAGDSTAPGVPTSLQARPSDRRVALTWLPNSTSDYVFGYHVYRAVGSDPPARITQEPVVVLSFTDQGLDNGTTYRYSVSAVDTAGLESGLSAEVQATPHDDVPPGPPQGLTLRPDCTGTNRVEVSWAPNSGTDGTVTYRLFREPPFTNEAWVPAVGTSYPDADTQPGTVYEYWVKAVDEAENLSEESTRVGTRTSNLSAAVPVPATPYAESGDGRVDLRIVVNPDYTTFPYVRVYRKRNIELTCDYYQFIGEFATIEQRCLGAGADQTCYLEVPDVGLPNTVAYDYAVTHVDHQGRESYYSTTALAAPVAKLTNYRECIDAVGPAPADGATNCPWSGNPYNYNRTKLGWDTPREPIYHPMSATNASGALGYFKGVRVYRYWRLHSETGDQDHTTVEPQRLDSQKSQCRSNPDIACFSCPIPWRFLCES
jgi:YD repeat-containing protein